MIALLAPIALLAQAGRVETLKIEGLERRALIFAPTVKTAKPPVVLAFHGHGGNMNSASRSFGVQSLWPEAVVAYPEGMPTKGRTDPEGVRNGWQNNAGELGDRDLKFVDALLAKIKKDFSVDDSRVYAMGHSNGGRFVYLLWAERGEQFAAFGPSGSPAVLLVRKFVPRSAFLIAGQGDKLVSFDGQRLTADALRRLLKTDGLKPRKDGYAAYETGPNGLELGTYFHPGGHEYPEEGAKLTIELFKRHALPGKK